VFLLDASVRENIALESDPARIDDARVEQAAIQAGLHDFVSGLPQGYETAAGERGIRFSGGQRQRLVIARALYRNPDVLILDEATSALDHETEREVIRSIERLGSGLTIIMIAHRLTTLEGCDMVVQLASGRIAQLGTYESVVRHRSIGPSRLTG
jgi:ATP-binding cassette subfamily B protein